ncbi:DUF4129 domain-containing protein [Haloferax sp. S1W]|uniref:DUF4129 domain-containing protein n=1 Tax=Haloferax sp. S1W TaxID=3377110 RepID=UPI0037C96D08
MNSSRVLTWVLVCLVVCSAVAPGVAASAHADRTLDVSRVHDAPLQVETPDAQNNSTTQHENPDETDDSGDLSAVKGWLSGRMSETLVNCVRENRTLDRAVCSRLNRSYPDWVSKYVNVTRETESEQDDEVASRFNESRKEQQRFVESLTEFQETKEQYETARENGNTTRARELARELSKQAETVNESATNLNADFGWLSNETSANLTSSAEAISELSNNTTASAEQIRELEFVETSLSVSLNRSQIAYDSPVVLVGSLDAAGGETVANRTVRIRVGSQTHTVSTNSTGGFSLQYRPTLVSNNATTLDVAYIPRPTSLYDRSDATVPVSITQTNTTVTVTTSTDTVRFGDRLRIRGTATASGHGVADIPVRVVVGNRVLRTETGENGTFTHATDIPASLSTGTVSVRAALALDEQALRRSTAESTLVVNSTPTVLSVDAADVSSSNATVRGRLTTEDGEAVPNSVVRLQVNSTTVGRVRTNATGAFRSQVNLSAIDARQPTVVAVFDPQGGNLESATGRAQLTVPSAMDGGLDALTLVGAAAGLLILGLGGVFVARASGVLPPEMVTALLSALPGGTASRREDIESESTEDSTESPESNPESPSQPAQDAQLDALEAHLERGDVDAAVIGAYDLVREDFRRSFDLDSSFTHWEFLEHVRPHVTDDEMDAARELTESYETAAFAPEAVSEKRGTRAVEIATTRTGETDQF